MNINMNFFKVIAGNHDIVLDKASYEDHLR